MGDTYKKAIGWFLRFALCDLSTLSTGDWTNLRFELTSFRERGVSNEKNALAFMKGEGHVFSNYDWRDRSNPQEGLITRDEVIAFQILAREALDVIRDKRSKAFRFPSLERRLSFNPMQLILNNKMVIRASWVVQTIADDPMEALTYAMLDLLKEQANFIRQCPELSHAGCQKLFLAERKNQSFCSIVCQSRAATRRYRIEHGLSSGRPRGRPRKVSTIQANPAKPKSEMLQNRRGPHGKTKRQRSRHPTTERS
jgi:hypothetical protein